MSNNGTTEAAQILAQGAPITFNDGRVFHIRYGLLALQRLEEAFGSTNGIDQALEDAEDGTGRSFSSMFELLAAGLLDSGLTREEIDRGIDLQRLPEYISAVQAAVIQAFGPAEKKRSSGKARTKPAASRGRPGTTPPPSSSAEQTKPSGG